MTLGLFFWICMLLWIIFYGIGWRAAPQPWPVMGSTLLVFFIILALGWQVFGAPIK